MNGRPRPDAEVAERELVGNAAPICDVCLVPAIAHKGVWQCGRRGCANEGVTLGVLVADGRPELSPVEIARARVLAAGNRRRALEHDAEEAYRVALDVALEELERDPDGLTVAGTARDAAVHRSTVYNELGRRQERRDELSPTGPPAP